MLSEHIKRLLGALVGVAAGVLMLFIGFWKTLLICALAFAGWWLTGKRQLPQALLDFIARLFRIN